MAENTSSSQNNKKQIITNNNLQEENDIEENPDTISDNSISSPTSPKKEKSLLKVLYEYTETFCYALVLMILLFMFVFRYVSVDGDSMRDTLHDEDKLVISNLAYTPETGDIVVIKNGSQPIIKRIIATEGQTVKIDFKNWKVYVDGVLLDETYVRRTSGAMVRHNIVDDEFTVEEGMVFVLGDNRNNSRDSRYFGEFREDDILGRVIFRVFPISEFGSVD